MRSSVPVAGPTDSGQSLEPKELYERPRPFKDLVARDILEPDEDRTGDD